MYVTDSVDEYDDEPLSTEMLEDICDSSQYHPIINSREARYKIHDHIKRSQLEYKGDLLYTQNMGKGLHKLFKAAVNEILQVFPIFCESGSEVSHFIPDPRNFSEVTILSPWIKSTLKEIKNLINKQTFLV